MADGDEGSDTCKDAVGNSVEKWDSDVDVGYRYEDGVQSQKERGEGRDTAGGENL